MKTLIVRAWKLAWDAGEVDALDQIFHTDYRRENGSSGRITNLSDLKRDILDVRNAFPDLSSVLSKVVLDGNDGALFWESIGTFRHDLGGVPATGGSVTTRGSNEIQLLDGLIVYEKVTWDTNELLADSGVSSLRTAFEEEPDVVIDDLTGSLDMDVLKGFNRQFITGVTVVTTIDESGKPLGLAVNSYASVSLEPPLVLICVQKTSSTYGALFKSSHLGINIMSNKQSQAVGIFARKSPDKFDALEWQRGPYGSPLIDGSSAVIEAQIKERYQAKTHTVFIAKVVHAKVSEVAPMIYKAGKFYDGSELVEL